MGKRKDQKKFHFNFGHFWELMTSDDEPGKEDETCTLNSKEAVWMQQVECGGDGGNAGGYVEVSEVGVEVSLARVENVVESERREIQAERENGKERNDGDRGGKAEGKGQARCEEPDEVAVTIQQFHTVLVPDLHDSLAMSISAAADTFGMTIGTAHARSNQNENVIFENKDVDVGVSVDVIELSQDCQEKGPNPKAETIHFEGPSSKDDKATIIKGQDEEPLSFTVECNNVHAFDFPSISTTEQKATVSSHIITEENNLRESEQPKVIILSTNSATILKHLQSQAESTDMNQNNQSTVVSKFSNRFSNILIHALIHIVAIKESPPKKRSRTSSLHKPFKPPTFKSPIPPAPSHNIPPQPPLQTQQPESHSTPTPTPTSSYRAIPTTSKQTRRSSRFKSPLFKKLDIDNGMPVDSNLVKSSVSSGLESLQAEKRALMASITQLKTQKSKISLAQTYLENVLDSFFVHDTHVTLIILFIT
jgi:hypothetical protein